MIRTLTSNQLSEISAKGAEFYHLLRLDSSPALTLTTCYKDITYNSETYDASGFLIQVPTIDDDLDLKINKYQFALSAVNQANTAAFLLDVPYYKKIELFKFWLDSDGAMIDSPVSIWAGYFAGFGNEMNQSKGSSEMKIKAVGEFVDFDRVNGRQTNNESQQRIFSGDTGLRHSETQYSKLSWGRPD